MHHQAIGLRRFRRTAESRLGAILGAAAGGIGGQVWGGGTSTHNAAGAIDCKYPLTAARIKLGNDYTMQCVAFHMLLVDLTSMRVQVVCVRHMRMGMFVFKSLMVMAVRLKEVSTTPTSISTPPTTSIQVPVRLPNTNAPSTPINDANANTQPVRLAPTARCASNYKRRLSP